MHWPLPIFNHMFAMGMASVGSCHPLPREQIDYEIGL